MGWPSIVARPLAQVGCWDENRQVGMSPWTTPMTPDGWPCGIGSPPRPDVPGRPAPPFFSDRGAVCAPRSEKNASSVGEIGRAAIAEALTGRRVVLGADLAAPVPLARELAAVDEGGLEAGAHAGDRPHERIGRDRRQVVDDALHEEDVVAGRGGGVLIVDVVGLDGETGVGLDLEAQVPRRVGMPT